MRNGTAWKRSKAWPLALFVAMSPAGAVAQEPVQPPQELQSAVAAESTVESFTLDNGLQVVVIPDRRAPVVTHMLWYKIGSADEAPGKSGIAHFFEHLMFKGTSNNPAGAFSAAVAAIGGSENAFTSYDYTAYFQQVSPDALETMMRFEADRMRNLVLTEAVIGPERDVVLEERRSRIETDPGALLNEEMSATLYQNHPYGIPVIGWMHEMETLNRADAIDFYNRYYAPNNAVLIVAGDVDTATVRALAEKTYGAVPRGPDLPPRVRPTEPEQNTSRTVSLSDPRVSLPSYQKSWVVPSYTTAEDGEAEALDLLGEILGGGARSRLYQALVVQQGVAASVGSYYQGTALDDSSFTVYGTPRGGASLEQVEAAVDAEIERLATAGVNEQELERAKNRFVRSMIFARDNQSGMARMYGAALATGGTIEDVERWPDRIRAVTAADVQEAAKRYLDNKRAVSSYLLPAGEEKS
ncbi:M16 family metallopeptidase [Tianweitania sediminis]|uniref:Insulinase family protein n=1 Tax=Tianweitania sediminis TaxID=1502156 RepID=A0A8J7R1T0_9HYPH|nr:pitrilysin family protein [Tianweitania sediminis]MBP0438625.1 insulinase family protein [Tianweitania sediminis]